MNDGMKENIRSVFSHATFSTKIWYKGQES